MADELRAARLARGLSQRELARRVGCDQSLISRVEAGVVKTVNWHLALDIARVLRVPAKRLWGAL